MIFRQNGYTTKLHIEKKGVHEKCLFEAMLPNR